jgi:L-ascorbate metabolism protein UlaG (beta-lactamase superfamily)
MEITYIGHSCFKLKGKDATLVIDPYNPEVGYKMPKTDADILLVTHDHFDHNNVSAVTNVKLLIKGPGEYETKGTFIHGISTFHDDKQGAERGVQTIYEIDFEGMTVVHLGDLGHELSKDTLEKISKVDVLLIPVGGFYTINAKTAAKVVAALEPGYVIPMHYKTADFSGSDELEPLSKFLDEMGLDDKSVRKEDKLKLSSKSDIPEETEVIVLNPSH